MDALVIFNPRASRLDERARAAVLKALRPLQVDVADTEHPGHATELAAAAAAEGRSFVVTVGGDGTANEAANGLVHSETALWALPGGGTNVFARSLGIPEDLDAATAVLAAERDRAEITRTTMGVADGRHFLFMAGVGVTAALMRRAAERPELRARLGNAYVAYGAATTLVDASRGRLPRVDVCVGDTVTPADSVVVQRSDPLTYFGRRPVSVCDPQHLGNGTLSAALASGVSLADVAGIFTRLLSGEHDRVADHPRVALLDRLSDLEVRSQDGQPFDLEVDGTWVGRTGHARFGVVPEALLVARPGGVRGSAAG